MISRTKPRVLLVDDSPSSIRILVETLRDSCTLAVAKNGKRALEMVCVHPLPEVILLDIMMPEIDGYQVCRQLKQMELCRDIPVLFITSLQNVEQEQKALAVGAVDFIRKPINPAVVRARTLTHVELVRARLRLVEQNRQLQENEQRLREITATLAEGLYVIDREGLITFINPTALAMLGWREEEVLGQSAHALFHHTRVDGTPSPPEECFQHDVLNRSCLVIPEKEWFWHRNGTSFPVALTASPILRTEEVHGAVVAFRDITKRKKAEEMLRQAKEQAEIASKAKGDFLIAMSHEVRSPMNVVLGMSGVLLETDLTQEQRGYVELMHKSGGVLLAIVNDVLDVSRIESGQFTMVDLPFSPVAMMEEITRIMRLSAEQKGLTLISEVLPGIPDTMVGDDGRVRQVIFNLIGNAVKFTDQGQIEVRLAPHPQEPNVILFSVSDTGIGIAPHNLGRIFERFTQVDAGIARRYGGTGLGLAIARRLVELMGGRMWVESQLGKGSTFFITLPVRTMELPLPQATLVEMGTGETIKSMHILLVEDSLENQMLIQIYLKRTPHQLLMANNGMEALARVREEVFDLVLMDLQMPVLDGYCATRQIRQWEKEEGRQPLIIIALSAHSSADKKLESLAAGCDDHLSKPIKKQDLLVAIQQVSKDIEEKNKTVAPAMTLQ